MRPRAHWLLIPLLAAAVPGTAPAQERPATEVFRDQVRVTEVLLDVVVTDRDDRIIVGLGPDDFVVRDASGEVDLTSVTFYSSKRLLEPGRALAAPGAAVDTVPQDRHFILFVEEQPFQRRGLRPSLLDRQLQAGRQLGQWLVEETQPADRVAVLSYRGRLKVHQDFTADRAALIEAVDGAVHGRDPEKIPPSRRHPVESPSALSALPAGKELERSSRDIYQALRLVADAVKGVPGRKNLIFVGRGFGDIGSHGNYRPEHFKLDPMLQALNDANVAVYALDVAPPGVTYNLQIALRDLAAATGGRFYYDRTSFTPALEQISDLTSGYYLLSYQSRRPADAAGYQRVTVATRNPEFRIQARDGYLYGPRPKP